MQHLFKQYFSGAMIVVLSTSIMIGCSNPFSKDDGDELPECPYNGTYRSIELDLHEEHNENHFPEIYVDHFEAELDIDDWQIKVKPIYWANSGICITIRVWLMQTTNCRFDTEYYWDVFTASIDPDETYEANGDIAYVGESSKGGVRLWQSSSSSTVNVDFEINGKWWSNTYDVVR